MRRFLISALATLTLIVPVFTVTPFASAHTISNSPALTTCTDAVVWDMGWHKFLQGAGYIELRTKLHSMINITNGDPCGSTRTEVDYICSNPQPAPCNNSSVAEIKSELISGGPNQVIICYLYTGGSCWTNYINTWGQSCVWANGLEWYYNDNVNTPCYSD